MSKTSQLAENKLIILYLVAKVGVPISNGEICQFAIGKNYMDYFSVQQYLSELVGANFLEKNKDNNETRYLITDDGSNVLAYFIKHISEYIKNEISNYVNDNTKRIRSEYEVTANYFLELSNEYLVKCSVCDCNGNSLMEISAVVPTKNQAQLICSNWKENINSLYSSILSNLLHDKQKNDETRTADIGIINNRCYDNGTVSQTGETENSASEPSD